MLGRGRINVWFNSLTPEQRSAHARFAGKQRWKHATLWDHLMARDRLRRHRLSRAEALKRLTLARAVLAARRAEKAAYSIDLSSMPRL
jgi:hypothetical protein